MNTDHRFPRRAFLKSAWLMAGSTVFLPVFASPQHAPSTSARLRIAALLPEATVSARAADDLALGLRMALEEMGWRAGDVALDLDIARAGPAIRAVSATARALVEQAQPDLLVSMVSEDAQNELAGWLQSSGIPLVNLDAGVNVARATLPGANLSIPQWEANWAFGSWACQHIGWRGFIAMSFYESGFDTSFAFRHGFEQAGGEVLGARVIFTPQAGPALDTLLQHIEAAQPDFVYALFSGPQAAEFLAAYQANSATRDIPLLGAQALAEAGPTIPARTAAVWPAWLTGLAGEGFARRFSQNAGHAPGLFAALGYTTATAIAATLADQGAVGIQSGDFATALARRAPAWQMQVCECVADDSPTLPEPIARLDLSPALSEAVDRVRATVRSGWLYPYQCV